MKIDRAQYEAWQKRCSEIYSIVTDKNNRWVTPALGLTHQIERDCPDSNVKGNARTARRHASAFKTPTRNADVTDIYRDFLNAWQRLEMVSACI